jgi:hypothetical protein
MDKTQKDLLTWFKSEKLKDEERAKKAKESFINQIKQLPREELKNTPVVEKKYSIWERLKRTLGMN